MQALQNGNELANLLRQVNEGLDASIAQAIENPLLFAGSPTLADIGTLCASLASRVAGGGSASGAALETLAWEVRARAGRLQRLLDSASRFYAACFSTPQELAITGGSADHLAYGVHGEWGEVFTSGHLVFDC